LPSPQRNNVATRNSLARLIDDGGPAVTPCEDAVAVVGHGQHDGAGDRQESVCEDAQVCVCEGGADDQKQKACRAVCDDVPIPVSAEAYAQRDNAERHDNDEHLSMQMTFVKLREQRQARHDERQQQAVDEA